MHERLVLICRCGECTHWEIVRHEHEGKQSEAKLHCVTCKEEFPVTIDVPAHDKLSWAKRVAA